MRLERHRHRYELWRVIGRYQPQPETRYIGAWRINDKSRLSPGHGVSLAQPARLNSRNRSSMNSQFGRAIWSAGSRIRC